MSQARLSQSRQPIRRTFEVNRLAQTYLNEAYEKLIPLHVHVGPRQPVGRLSQHSQQIASTDRERRVV